MASLRQVTTEVIDSLGRPFDNMLYSRVRSALLNECVQWARRSINQRGIENEFKQAYVAELSLVDGADNPIRTSGSQILRTDNKILEPIRYEGDEPFTYVGAIDWNNSFIFTQPYESRTSGNLPMTGRAIRYFYLNGYIYVFNTTLVDQVAIEGIYVNPHDVIELNGRNLGAGLDDDMEFPFPADIIQLAKNGILKGELGQYDVTPNTEKSHVDVS